MQVKVRIRGEISSSLCNHLTIPRSSDLSELLCGTCVSQRGRTGLSRTSSFEKCLSKTVSDSTGVLILRPSSCVEGWITIWNVCRKWFSMDTGESDV